MEEAWDYSIKMVQNQNEVGYDNEAFSDFFAKENRTTVRKIFRRMDILIGQRASKNVWVPQWDAAQVCGVIDSPCYTTTILEDSTDGSDPLKQGDMLMHCCLLPDGKMPQNIPDLNIADIGDTVSDKMFTMAGLFVHEYVLVNFLRIFRTFISC